MFDYRDLFRWDQFITPSIIKPFYTLVIALIILLGLSGIFSGLATMAISPFGGFLMLLSSIASMVVGTIFARIAAEFVLIVFRINEHLGAIREQGHHRGCIRRDSPSARSHAAASPGARPTADNAPHR